MNSLSDALWLFIKCILCLLGVALVAIVGLVAVASYYQPPEPKLLNFSGNTNSFNHQFNQELMRYFPVGSEESALIRELSLERFQLFNDDNKAEKAATYDSIDDKSFLPSPCRYSATVHWSVNKAGRIISISGDYSEVCL